MKNQIHFLFKKNTPPLQAEQLLNNSLEMKLTSNDKPNRLMRFNSDKSSSGIFKKIHTMCNVLYKAKRKYIQERQSRNYWNSIN